MAAATAAMHLGAHHAKAAVGRRLDRACDGIIEARPAGATLELLLRYEQRLPATGADECAMALLIIERAASRRFGAVTPHHVVLLRREQAPPCLVGMRDRVFFGFHAAALSLGSGTSSDPSCRLNFYNQDTRPAIHIIVCLHQMARPRVHANQVPQTAAHPLTRANGVSSLATALPTSLGVARAARMDSTTRSALMLYRSLIAALALAGALAMTLTNA